MSHSDKTRTPKASDKEETSKLHAACSRIRAAIPELPYALSAPVNVEPRYHYPSRQEAESWQRGTPFYLHEEHLQYMTYVYREPGESCFVVRSHVDEEREAREAKERSHHTHSLGHSRTASKSEAPSVASTRPSTPKLGATANAGTKKKISLSAYKEKVAGGKAEKKEQTLVKEADAITQKPDLKRLPINGMSPKGESKMDVKKDKSLPEGTKRSRDAGLEKSAKAPEQTPLSKKPRLSRSPSPPLASARQASPRPSTRPSLQPSPFDHDQGHLHGAVHGLPPLLSPTNPFESEEQKPTPSSPEKKKKSKKWNLPGMLSPSLPAKIETQLAKEKEQGRPDSATSTPASNAARTPNSGQSPSSKPRLKAKLEESPLAKVKDGTNLLSKEAQSGNEDSSPPLHPVKPKRIIVRLRYSKRLAYRIRQLLRVPPQADRERFPLDEDYLRRIRFDRPISKSGVGALDNRSRPQPSSDTDPPIQRPRKDTISKDEEKRDRLHPDSARSTKVPEKRPRQADSTDPQPSAKKQKMPPVLDSEKEKNPRTPTASAISSPSVQKSGGSLKESVTVTPRQNHLKAVAMARSVSQDSPVATPNGKNISTPQPSTSSRVGGKGPTSAPLNSTSGARAQEIKALFDQSQKYNALGRKLKHENQDISNQATKTDRERKRMALLGIECIMAYMLAYSLGDSRRKIEGRSAEIESSWKTLLPLFKHMGRFVSGYKPLDGLYAYLGITINARISIVAGDRVQRAANLPVAADSPQSTTTNPNDPTSIDNMRTHFDASSAMFDLSRDAAQKLPVDEIMASFPATWASRSKEVRGPSAELLIDEGKKDVSMSGGYWLPVQIDSAPVQAVRFGARLIREMIQVEESGYEPRIRI